MAHPSDCAPALIALNATVHITGPAGSRSQLLQDFYRLPSVDVTKETSLQSDEIVTHIEIPFHALKSTYLKCKEKEIFYWALASVAVALELENQVCVRAQIVLGGIAPIPWRAHEAETLLQGQMISYELARDAAEAVFEKATPLRENEYKVEIAKALMIEAITKFQGGTGIENSLMY